MKYWNKEYIHETGDSSYLKWTYEDYKTLVSCFMNKMNMLEISEILDRSQYACWTRLRDIKDTDFYFELIEKIKEERRNWYKKQNEMKKGLCYIRD